MVFNLSRSVWVACLLSALLLQALPAGGYADTKQRAVTPERNNSGWDSARELCTCQENKGISK